MERTARLGQKVFVIASREMGIVTGIRPSKLGTHAKNAKYICIYDVRVERDGRVVDMCLQVEAFEFYALDIFPVETKVVSTLSKHEPFQGTVLGVEDTTNRLICVSRKNSKGDRVRYSYRADELEERTDRCKLFLNGVYRVNSSKDYRLVECPVQGSPYMLIDHTNGTLGYLLSDLNPTIVECKEANISGIEFINVFSVGGK